MQNLVFIGCGNMGAAMIKAVLDNAVYGTENLVIVEKKANIYTKEFADQGIAVFTQLKDFQEISFAFVQIRPKSTNNK